VDGKSRQDASFKSQRMQVITNPKVVNAYVKNNEHKEIYASQNQIYEPLKKEYKAAKKVHEEWHTKRKKFAKDLKLEREKLHRTDNTCFKTCTRGPIISGKTPTIFCSLNRKCPFCGRFHPECVAEFLLSKNVNLDNESPQIKEVYAKGKGTSRDADNDDWRCFYCSGEPLLPNKPEKPLKEVASVKQTQAEKASADSLKKSLEETLRKYISRQFRLDPEFWAKMDKAHEERKAAKAAAVAGDLALAAVAATDDLRKEEETEGLLGSLENIRYNALNSLTQSRNLHQLMSLPHQIPSQMPLPNYNSSQSILTNLPSPVAPPPKRKKIKPTPEKFVIHDKLSKLCFELRKQENKYLKE
jgi:hypothetical protein